MATKDFLECKYMSPDGKEMTNIFVSSINSEYRHNVDSKHTPGTNKTSAKDNGVGERIHSMEFYFFDEKISSGKSMDITDAVYNGKSIPEINIKNASVYAKFFNALLQKIGLGKLTHPSKGEIKVIPLSVSERVDLVTNIGMVIVSVTFQEVDSIMTDSSTTKDSQTTKDDIISAEWLVFNHTALNALGGEHLYDPRCCIRDELLTPQDKIFTSGDDGFRETP